MPRSALEMSERVCSTPAADSCGEVFKSRVKARTCEGSVSPIPRTEDIIF